MRIMCVSALPAVVVVKGPGVCAVAIPDSLPSDEVLELASLVLSNAEYEEVRDAVTGENHSSATESGERTAESGDQRASAG